MYGTGAGRAACSGLAILPVRSCRNSRASISSVESVKETFVTYGDASGFPEVGVLSMRACLARCVFVRGRG